MRSTWRMWCVRSEASSVPTLTFMLSFRLLLVSFLCSGIYHGQISDAVLTFPSAPAFTPDSFPRGSRNIAVFLCTADETDMNFPLTSSIEVKFLLSNGSILPDGVSGNGKYTVSSTYIPTSRSNSAQLFIGTPVALDSGTYMCMASTSPTVNKTATARLEVTAPPVFDVTSLVPNGTLLVGDTFTLQCSIEEDVYPLPAIEWSKNKIMLLPAKVSDISYTYSVSSARLSDGGVYECKANNTVGTIMKSITVTVEAPPNIKSFCEENGVVCTGKNTTLTCSASGVPHPDVQITGVHSSAVSTNVSTIFLKPVVESDKGLYTCTTNNRHGVDMENCTVNIGVSADAHLSVIPSNITFQEGDSLQLNCATSGIPTPTVVWFQNGNEKTKWRNMTVLMLIAAVEYHGTYQCVVSNLCQRDKYSNSVMVNVEVPCNIASTSAICMSNSTCPSLQQQTVSLVAEGRCFPVMPTVVLLNETGGEISRSNITTSRPPEDAYRVPLQVTTTQAGKYAFQIDGTNIKKLEEIIFPRIQSATLANASHPVVLTVSQPSQKLMCVGCSYPCHPDIQWSKQQTVQPAVNNTYTDTKDAFCVTSKLTVSSPGDYKCQLCGSMDERTLVINAEPTFVTSDTSVDLKPTVNESGNLMLDCTVTGRPDGSIRWTLDGNAVPAWNDQAMLTLSNVQIADNQRYNCTGSNKHGMVTREFVVNVVVPPQITNSSSLVNLPLGATVDLFCDARGYPDEPKIVWTNSSGSILHSLDRSSVGSDMAKLIHSVVSVNKTGTYTCGIDSTNKKRQIEVVAYLTIISTTPDGHLGVSGPIELACEARAYPDPPIITWKSQDGAHISDRLDGISSDLPDGSYSQRSTITTKTMGVYICHAEAAPGSQTQERSITVGPAPTSGTDQTPTTILNTTTQSQSPDGAEDTIFGLNKKLYDWLIIAGIAVVSLIILIVICCVCYCCICSDRGDKTDGLNVELQQRRRLDDDTHFYGPEGRGLADSAYDDVNSNDYAVEGPTSSTFRPKTKVNEYQNSSITGAYEQVNGQNQPLTKAMQRAIVQETSGGYATVPDEEDDIEGPYAVAHQRKASAGQRPGSVKRPESNLVIDNPGAASSGVYSKVDMTKKQQRQQAAEPTDPYTVVDKERKRSQGRREEPTDAYAVVDKGRKRSDSAGRHQSFGQQTAGDGQYSLPHTGSQRRQRPVQNQPNEGSLKYAEVEFADGSSSMHRRRSAGAGEGTKYSAVMFPGQEVVEAEL